MNTPFLSPISVLRGPVTPAASLPAPAQPRRRILVVDDDSATRVLHCLLLVRAGFEAESAADGEQAWSALRSASYDLVLTDEQMPHLTGLGLVGRMRVAGMHLPVIVNSGCAELGAPSDYPQLGLAAVLRKPVTFGELLEAVRRHVPGAPHPTAPVPAPGQAPGAMAAV